MGIGIQQDNYDTKKNRGETLIEIKIINNNCVYKGTTGKSIYTGLGKTNA